LFTGKKVSISGEHGVKSRCELIFSNVFWAIATAKARQTCFCYPCVWNAHLCGTHASKTVVSC
jgi:hypothetical protein